MLQEVNPPLGSDALQTSCLHLSYMDSPSSQEREIDILGHSSSDRGLDHCFKNR